MTHMQNIKIAAGGKYEAHNDIIDWPAVSDQKLVDLIVSHPDTSRRGGRAWVELLARFDAAINKRIRFVVSNCAPMYRASDMLDEIKAKVFLALLVNNKARLRAFDASRGSLHSWLTMITKHTALSHLTRLASLELPAPNEAIEADDDPADGDDYFVCPAPDSQRAAYWIAEGV